MTPDEFHKMACTKSPDKGEKSEQPLAWPSVPIQSGISRGISRAMRDVYTTGQYEINTIAGSGLTFFTATQR